MFLLHFSGCIDNNILGPTPVVATIMASKAHLRLNSQSSQGSSQGTPVNCTPVTHRKSILALAGTPLSSPMLSHLVNDDQSEKKRRLQARLSDVAQRHQSSPASERLVVGVEYYSTVQYWISIAPL